MADGNEIELRVTADISEFQDAVQEVVTDIDQMQESLAGAGDAAADTAGGMQKAMDAMSDAGEEMLKAGAAMALGVGYAVKTYADFDKAMSGFKAVSGAGESDLDALGETAMNLGREWGIAATDVVGAASALSKTGISTADIMGGALAGALTLAAAGSMDVADAADAAAIAMTQFRLNGGDVPHIADLLAAGAANAVGEVSDLTWGLRQVGLVAGNTGLSIDETVGTLSAFASAGLIGSDAGTSFKSMLMAIAAPTSVAQKELDKYNLSFYDTEGAFIGVSAAAEMLKTQFAGVKQESRDAAFSIIFGQDAVRSATLLYQLGAEGIEEWIGKVDQQGFAAEMARQKMDNLAGDLSKLHVAFQNVFIEGGAGVNDMLRNLTQQTTGFLDAVGDVPKPVLELGLNLTAAATAALMLGGGLMTLGPKLYDAYQNFRTFNREGGRFARVMTGAAKVTGAAIAVFAGFELAKSIHNSMQPAAKDTEEFSRALIGLKTDGESINKMFQGMTFLDAFAFGKNEIDSIGDALNQTINPANLLESFGATNLGVDNGLAKMRDGISKVDQAMAAQVTGGNFELAADGWRAITESASEYDLSQQELIDRFPALMAVLREGANQTGEQVNDTQLLTDLLNGSLSPALQEATGAVSVYTEASGDQYLVTEEVSEALAEMGIALDGTITNLSNFVPLLLAAGAATLGARDAARGYEGAMDNMAAVQQEIINSGAALSSVLNKNGTDFNISTDAGLKAQAAFDGIAAAGINTATSMADAGKSQGQIQKKLRGTADDLYATAKAFGMSDQAASDLTREVLGVPDGVDIDSWMSSEAKRMAEQTKGAIDQIPKNVTVSIWQTTYRSIVDKHGEGSQQEADFLDNSGMGTVGAAADAWKPSAKNRAIGGPIIGPGNGMSDTAGIYALSNGEHLWTAAEVMQAGGHEAVAALRRAARTGALRYASYASPGQRGGQVAGAGGGRSVQLTLNNVPMDHAQKTADTLLFALNHADRGGKYV